MKNYDFDWQINEFCSGDWANTSLRWLRIWVAYFILFRYHSNLARKTFALYNGSNQKMMRI
jgi:hypothetical protein